MAHIIFQNSPIVHPTTIINTDVGHIVHVTHTLAPYPFSFFVIKLATWGHGSVQTLNMVMPFIHDI